jgi:hypothetical protein
LFKIELTKPKSVGGVVLRRKLLDKKLREIPAGMLSDYPMMDELGKAVVRRATVLAPERDKRPKNNKTNMTLKQGIQYSLSKSAEGNINISFFTKAYRKTNRGGRAPYGWYQEIGWRVLKPSFGIGGKTRVGQPHVTKKSGKIVHLKPMFTTVSVRKNRWIGGTSRRHIRRGKVYKEPEGLPGFGKVPKNVKVYWHPPYKGRGYLVKGYRDTIKSAFEGDGTVIISMKKHLNKMWRGIVLIGDKY